MVALEGQGLGLPVLAPDAGPFPFMIENGVSGALYEVNSVDDLRCKLEALLSDEALCRKLGRGALGRTRVRAQSSRSFGEVLKEICARIHRKS